MAIIHGRTPDATPLDAPVRVVVKLAEPVATVGGAHAELERFAAGERIAPYFEAEDVAHARRPPFDRYVAIEASDREQAAAMAPKLRELPNVEDAYVEAGPVPPPFPWPLVPSPVPPAGPGGLPARPTDLALGARGW